MTKQELASKIWETANELRSKIKANEYKDYILGFMFYRFLSDKEENYIYENGGTIEELRTIDNITMIQEDIGYFISADNLFSTWQNLGIELGASIVIDALDSFNKNIEPRYKKVFDNIFSTLRNGLSKLGDSSGSRDKAIRDIINLITDIPATDKNYDVMGYIYEFLIYKFSIAAKEDGAFYTPHEVSSLIAQIIANVLKDKTELKVYDPTSGSGSLLLNIGHEASKYINKDNIKYYGQEKIAETYHLTRMNLIIKGISVGNICVRNSDTLEDDWLYFDEETNYNPLYVNAVVSNPPYSLKWNPEEKENDPRFKYGLAPSGKADYAFLQHCLYHLQPDGVMAIVLPHGVLFRGDAEGVIRKNLIENNHIETIIGLPSNLFYATGIPTIVMVLRKNRNERDVLFIDASQEYAKGKKQNVLRDCDIKRILDVIKDRKSVENFSRVVDIDEIVKNDYNLNIPRYVSATKKAESYDLYSVMSGKISNKELNQFETFWNQFPSLRNKITTNEGEYSEILNENIGDVINSDDDVIKFKEEFNDRIDGFRKYLINTLINNLDKYTLLTKDEIVNKLFELLENEDIIDKYYTYQVLAENWSDIDSDILAIQSNGFDYCKNVEPNMITKKDSKIKKTIEEQKGWKGSIIPFNSVKKMFFVDAYKQMNDLSREADSVNAEYMEILDNLDDDVKESVAKEDMSNFDMKKLNASIKVAIGELLNSLKNAKKLIEKEKEINKDIKDIESSLDEKTKNKFKELSNDDVKLLLEEKWINPIINGIVFILNKSINDFIKSLENLRNKYSISLLELEKKEEEVSRELISMLDKLVGNETDMMAIQMLKKALM